MTPVNANATQGETVSASHHETHTRIWHLLASRKTTCLSASPAVMQIRVKERCPEVKSSGLLPAGCVAWASHTTPVSLSFLPRMQQAGLVTRWVPGCQRAGPGRRRPDGPTGDRQTPGATQRQGIYSWQPVSQEGAGHLGRSEGP